MVNYSPNNKLCKYYVKFRNFCKCGVLKVNSITTIIKSLYLLSTCSVEFFYLTMIDNTLHSFNMGVITSNKQK